MRGADRVVVNSGFTKGIVSRVWPNLGGERGIGIVYPCVDVEGTKEELEAAGEKKPLWEDKKVVLSINRFERKKDVGLAIRAFAGLSDEVRRKAKLVIAGKLTQVKESFLEQY